MYNKLFTKILDSSIWLEDQPTRIVWVTFIACMDQDGTVALSSIGNVANRARVSIKEAEAAIHCLESPDEHNPDQDHEGRRIERIPGLGWSVLNAKKYRDIVTAETVRAQNRERQRKYRAQSDNADVTDSNASVTQGHENVTPSEAETKAKAKTKKKSCGNDEEFVQCLITNSAYADIDVMTEFAKAQTWCEVNNRQNTKRFFVNWLNRIQKPLAVKNVKGTNNGQYKSAAEKRTDLIIDNERFIQQLEISNASDADHQGRALLGIAPTADE